MTTSARMRVTSIGLCIIALLLILSSIPYRSHAQNLVQISVAVPDYMKQRFTRNLIDHFEATNPDIKVDIRYADNLIPQAGSDINDYLNKLQAFAASADVLFLNQNMLSPVATRSGYFLDLTPLLNSDSSFDPTAYHTSMLNAFKWDNGTWAFPLSTDLTVVAYIPAELDKLNLSYPDKSWTLDQFIQAARTIAKQAPSKVGMGVSVAWSPYVKIGLLRALLGHGFYDPASPDKIALDSPELVALLEKWTAFEDEGLIDKDNNIQDIPLHIATMGQYPMFTAARDDWAWSLLPSDLSVLSTLSFAISRGTEHPEVALKLVRFLADQPELWFGGIPAKRDLKESAVAKYPAPLQALVDTALHNAIPDAELRYGDYVISALDQGHQNTSIIGAILNSVESTARSDLKISEERKKTNIALTIATPVPTPDTTDKIILKFGGDSRMVGMHSSAQQALVKEFVSSNPQVAQVQFSLSNQNTLSQQAKLYDCFVKRGNAVPIANTSELLSFDPLLAADKNFSRDDLIMDILPQLQRDGKTWAIPLYIMPLGLDYNPEVFTRASAPLPKANWTINDFAETLKTLKATTVKPPFFPGWTANYILAIIVSYGGLPFDYRTDPPTVNFTDPDTVTAIRQALDLIKQGYIAPYKKFRFMEAFDLPNQNNTEAAVMTVDEFLAPVSLRLEESHFTKTSWAWVMYPKGSKYQPIMFEIGTAYISANTQNADACYRWIMTLHQHPEVLGGLPAYKAVLNDPNFPTTVGADFAAAIQPFYAALGKPDTVFIPNNSFSGNEMNTHFQMVQNNWLFGAFDAYLAGDTEIEPLLKEAESFTKADIACTARINMKDDLETYKQISKCALQADPSLKTNKDTSKYFKFLD